MAATNAKSADRSWGVYPEGLWAGGDVDEVTPPCERRPPAGHHELKKTQQEVNKQTNL